MHWNDNRRFRTVPITVIGAMLALTGGDAPTGRLYAGTLQIPATQVIRTGDVGRQLSDQDVADIQLALPDAERPWLLIGEPAQIAEVRIVAAYLPPDTPTPDVRRGSMVILRHDGRSADEWTVTASSMALGDTGNYVQVAVPGQSFDQIQNEQDLNRPFSVVGSFEDAELISLATFVRSNANPFIRDKPIVWLFRLAGDSATIRFRNGSMSWNEVTVRPEGERWTIVRTMSIMV